MAFKVNTIGNLAKSVDSTAAKNREQHLKASIATVQYLKRKSGLSSKELHKLQKIILVSGIGRF